MDAIIKPNNEVSVTASLMWGRALRDFGDGFVAVLLPVYLLALGLAPFQVGIVATAALLGSAILTLLIGLIGGRHDQRRLLLAAAALMVASGVAFAVIDEYALLAVVAFAGTVNPSSGSVSIFVPLEHAVLAGEVAPAERTRVFARYSLIGALAAAGGALAAAAPDQAGALGLTRLAPQAVLLCGPRAGRRRDLRPPAVPAACRRGAGGAGAARPLARHRLPAGGAVLARRLRRRPGRAIPPGAVAVSAFRAVVDGGRPVLLLGRRAVGLLVPGGGVAFPAGRAHQYHGLHHIPHLAERAAFRAPSPWRALFPARLSRLSATDRPVRPGHDPSARGATSPPCAPRRRPPGQAGFAGLPAPDPLRRAQDPL